MSIWTRQNLFVIDEFNCSHCGENHIKEEFVELLYELRLLFNRP